MSKVSMSSRPEPGYENMDHFSINVDYVAEMLRTIEFQTGAGAGTSAAMPRGHVGLPRAPGTAWGTQPSVRQSPPPPHALCGDASACAQEWVCVAPQHCPGPGSHAGLAMPWGGRAPADLSPHPTEPLGEDEADGPGDGSEAAADEDRLDSLEAPEATEGESPPCCAMSHHAVPGCFAWLQGCGGGQGLLCPWRGLCAVLCPAMCLCGCTGPAVCQRVPVSILSPAFPLQMWGRGRSQRALPMVRPSLGLSWRGGGGGGGMGTGGGARPRGAVGQRRHLLGTDGDVSGRSHPSGPPQGAGPGVPGSPLHSAEACFPHRPALSWCHGAASARASSSLSLG